MALESSPENKTPEVDQMLARFESRVNKGVVERAEMERSFALTDKAFKEAKTIMQAKNFLATATTADCKNLSNSWTAWAANGIFSGPENAALRANLQSIFVESGDPKVDLARRYARQVWRTQMTIYLVQEVGKLSKSDPEKSAIFEQVLAGQIVSEAEQSPSATLFGAMRLDSKLADKSYRDKLAGEMSGSTHKDVVPVAAVKNLAGPDVNITSIRIVVGGELITISSQYTEAFKLWHVVYKPEEGRIYAQMQNGCKGNLVIIDLDKKGAPAVPPPAPRPPVAPRPPEPYKPVKPSEPPLTPGPGEGAELPVKPRPSTPGNGAELPVAPRPGSGAELRVPSRPSTPGGGVELPVAPRPSTPGNGAELPVSPRPGVPGNGSELPLPARPLAPESLAITLEPKSAVLDAAASTEAGRTAIRDRFLSANGVVNLKGANAPYLQPLLISHLYQDEPLYANGSRVEFKQGAEGKTYYYPDGRRVQIKDGTRLLTEAQNNLHSPDGFRPADEYLLSRYQPEFERKFGSLPAGDPNELNRTWEGRLDDHEVLLSNVMYPQTHEDLALSRTLHLTTPGQKVVFFDVGPGIANQDLVLGDGKGKPAITSQELAQRFPSMDMVVLDLPEEVDHFTGAHLHGGYPPISEAKRAEMLAYPNIHVLRGDGLVSLAAQWNDPRTNPYPSRQRDVQVQASNTTVVIRTANSIDVYCDWETQVKPALMKMATDFKNQPVLLLFNQEILVKEAGSTDWSIVGKVSAAAFDHKYRDAGHSDLGGHPYIMYQS